jgi:predicted RNA-binding protein with PIN domain
MYAAGLMPAARSSGQTLQHARTRFLDRIANSLGAERCRLTTVVFDAMHAPQAKLAPEAEHREIRVVYATKESSADDRLELLIASHPDPKRLLVVSSDHRVQRAAARRKARHIDADSYWDRLDQARESARGRHSVVTRSRPNAAKGESEFGADDTELATELMELNRAPGAAKGFVPTVVELEAIQREVTAEPLEVTPRRDRRRNRR